jgi:hypothetical protein
MRRLLGSKTSTVALVTAIITTLAVLGSQGVVIGQPTSSHGGSPSDVFMQATPAVCSNAGSLMAQDLTLAEESHLLVYFTGEWTRLSVNETGFLWFRLDGTDTDFDWRFAGHTLPETTGTVMWTFEDVAAGTHTVSAHSQVREIPPGRKASAELRHCAFTVFVIPVAE